VFVGSRGIDTALQLSVRKTGSFSGFTDKYSIAFIARNLGSYEQQYINVVLLIEEVRLPVKRYNPISPANLGDLIL